MYESFREKERAGWGAKADFYQDCTAPLTTQVIPTLLAAARVRAGMELLDICTGPGYAAGAANAVCAKATGIDFASDMVRVAAGNFPNCTFLEGDAVDLDIPDNSFDAVVCPFGIFHIDRPAKAIAEAFRVLRPNGRYAFSQWCAPAESDFMRLVFGGIAKNSDLSVADPAPDAFEFSDRGHCKDVMQSSGFQDIEIDEVPSMYHAPEGDFFEHIIGLTVRTPMIVNAQSNEVKNLIRSEMNAGAAAYRGDQGIVIPVPSIVVSGLKPR